MNTEKIRAEFPALSRRTNNRRTIFFDNAAGTQVARQTIERINDYLINCNANTDGVFETSRRSDALISETRRAVADFIGAADANEVAFGPNMTTLTQSFARALGRSLQEGDEIITTRLEHEANVSPWLALTERGVRVRFAEIRKEDMTVDLSSLRAQLNERTRLVAIGLASNAFGTINPVAEVTAWARSVGALTFVDAVHYSPHGLIDVAALGCDVLAYSVYKSFGPHVGVLWGRREVMDKVEAYHLRTVRAVLPDKFEVGTQNHEGIAGTLGAIEYFESLGTGATRRARLVSAFAAITEYERQLSACLIETLSKLSHVKIYGITDRERLSERVPTLAVTVDGLTPRVVAEHLAAAGINVWSGNYYALEPMTCIGLEECGGAVRISLVHYNTFEEIEALASALAELK